MSVGTAFALVLLVTMAGLVMVRFTYAARIRQVREDAAGLWMSPLYSPETSGHREGRALQAIHAKIKALEHERDRLAVYLVLAGFAAVALAFAGEAWLA